MGSPGAAHQTSGGLRIASPRHGGHPMHGSRPCPPPILRSISTTSTSRRLHHFAGRGHFRAGELVRHEERDPETRFWWLDYESACDSDWEALTLDSGQIEHATLLVASVGDRLANVRDLWMPTQDRLVLVLEHLGHAAQAARLLGWTDPDDLPAIEARVQSAAASTESSPTRSRWPVARRSWRAPAFVSSMSSGAPMTPCVPRPLKSLKPSPRTMTCLQEGDSRSTGSCTLSSGRPRPVSRSGPANAGAAVSRSTST